MDYGELTCMNPYQEQQNVNKPLEHVRNASSYLTYMQILSKLTEHAQVLAN